MFKNYFYLFRSVIELQPILANCTITEAYSQEKEKLYLRIPSVELPHRHLIISTNPQFPFLLLKDELHKAKKNNVNFFHNYLPSKLFKIEISDNDRVIKFTTNNFDLYFAIRGAKTNIALIDPNKNFISFKKTSNESSDIYNGYNFINTPKQFKINYDDNNYKNIADLKLTYPMVSSEIKNELILRRNSDNFIDFCNTFKIIITEILNGKIRVGFNSDLNKLQFIPDSFKMIQTTDNKLFESYNRALQFYMTNFYKGLTKKYYAKELQKYFEKELQSLSSKLNKLKQRIDKGSKEDVYYNYGNYLLTNIYKLKRSMEYLEIDSETSSKNIKIKLDKKLSPKQNIDKYFEKAKDEKVNFLKSVELYNKTKVRYEEVLKDYNNFDNMELIDDIKRLHKKIIKPNKKIIKMDTGHKFKYWHYLIDDKYHLYVGRDSKSNDYLSIKFAKQNDYWFHARGLPGSHVVLRVDNVKIGIPKDIIKKGAAVAAYYSKAKTAGTAPVSYTLAKFVHKKKGMEPGKVLLSKESTLLVRPVIPKNCELINE